MKTNGAASTGMCDLTSFWLQSIIGGEIKTGFIAPSNESHFWLEHSGLIIDITADQFGLPPVIVSHRFEGIGYKYIELPYDGDMEYATNFAREFLRIFK